MPKTGHFLPLRLIQHLRHRFGRSGLILLLAMIALLAICLHHVEDGHTPWGREVAKRLDHGLALRVKEFAIIGVWWGCAIGAGISAALLLSASLWMPGGPNTPLRPAPPSPGGNPAFYLGMLAILATATAFRAPQLTHSLWNDEEYAMRRYAHGEWQQEKDQTWTFEAVPWQNTLFLNANGNNHLLHSVASRLSLEGWRQLHQHDRSAFNELALRMPSFLAGLFSIICIALIGVEVGGIWVGLGAAALLCLHPWHLRYTAEARGYSMMILFICIAAMALLHAIRRDKVLPWICFALAQAAFLLAFAGSLYIAITLNLFALIELIRRNELRRIRTLVAFNLLSSIPVLIWMLPSVPQLLAFLRNEAILSTPIGIDWARDLSSHLAAGLLWTNPEPEHHLGTSWLIEAQTLPWWSALMQYGLPVLALVGLLALRSGRAASRLLIWPVLAGAALAISHNALSGESMLSWYLIYLLLPLCIIIPLALQWLLPRPAKVAAPAIAVLIGAYALATEAPRQTFVTHARQPIRETVAAYRQIHPDALAAVFGISDRQILSYDPHANVIEDTNALEALEAQAAAANVPLVAVFCGRTQSAQRHPALFAAVTQSNSFRFLSEHKGLEAMFTYEVWQWTPAPPLR